MQLSLTCLDNSSRRTIKNIREERKRVLFVSSERLVSALN
jgi:hypothetical protein